MVNLQRQYLNLKGEIDQAIQEVLDSASFINGDAVKQFARELSIHTGSNYIVPCANGTDALQIALMALGLEPGDEVIVPAFTYIASAEAIALLKLKPVLVDVDSDNFNLATKDLELALSARSKAIMPVHLFGQSCPMDDLMNFAKEHELYVIEDNAQAIGSRYTFADGNTKQSGCIGHFGCTSFFPSKNLGAYGDGGALFTQSEELFKKAQMIANHGQQKRYYHELIGCNSRLDSIQAAILRVKLKRLDSFIESRNNAASYYSQQLAKIKSIKLPKQMPYSTHVFHQYTLQVEPHVRDSLKKHLESMGIDTAIYYPLALQEQRALKDLVRVVGDLYYSEQLARRVLSIPIFPEISRSEQDRVIEAISSFYND